MAKQKAESEKQLKALQEETEALKASHQKEMAEAKETPPPANTEAQSEEIRQLKAQLAAAQEAAVQSERERADMEHRLNEQDGQIYALQGEVTQYYFWGQQAHAELNQPTPFIDEAGVVHYLTREQQTQAARAAVLAGFMSVSKEGETQPEK